MFTKYQAILSKCKEMGPKNTPGVCQFAVNFGNLDKILYFIDTFTKNKLHVHLDRSFDCLFAKFEGLMCYNYIATIL